MAATEKKSKMPFSVRFALFCLMVAGALVFPTTLLLCTCLVPTFVAAVVDPHPQKTAWVTVGCMNFTGTVPAWFDLWSKGNDLHQSLALLMDTHTYLISYGAALAGWVLYHNVTPFVAGMMVMKSEKRLKDIDKRQRELIRKWGTDVSGN
ncbi:MAG: hypothetical protein GC185_11105 [Alphaproteobacteria bacterium]|nr:hypothetical protein [Alphaproteobacteria bacterium]